MKKYFYLFPLLFSFQANAQIITPVLKANFGVEGDLGANYWQTLFSSTGGDDWFNQFSSYSGIGVIDTTGAAVLNAGYASNPLSRQLTFEHSMAVTPLTVVNNSTLIDAVFYRDYHGSDSTMYASGSSKNGMSPADWSCPVAQSVPDKNEILDVMAHMRRAGKTANDSLWLFGGVSIENTTGDRYFDFELYQTDMYYNKSTQKFYNYGPDAGHTAWQFNASGVVTKVGDVIFSADYGSSSLSSLEARIWINKSSLSVTPVGFNWSGSFDGASSGATYGYAGILPKSAGAFYTGIESAANTWAGPFSLIRGDNSLVTEYTAGQFMEFAVNLSKLGLDPKTLLANVGCQLPIKRIFVKSRASTSFTAQLKDFVGPLDLYQDFIASGAGDFPVMCGIIGPTHLTVTNPIPTINYTWTTTNGHIVGSATGNSIVVDSAGTYILSARILSSCPAFAKDTVIVPPFNPDCFTLETGITEFTGQTAGRVINLNWSVTQNNQINDFEIEYSLDGIHFYPAGTLQADPAKFSVVNYRYTTPIPEPASSPLFYRIKLIKKSGGMVFSQIIPLSVSGDTRLSLEIIPNPVRSGSQVIINCPVAENVLISIHDTGGRLLYSLKKDLPKGYSAISIPDFQNWPAGVYSVRLVSGRDYILTKMVIRN